MLFTPLHKHQSFGIRIQGLISQHLEKDFPACDLVILQKGQLILQGSWGVCQEVEENFERIYDWASVTKLFTTILALQALSRGGLHLNSPLTDWLPEFGAINPRAMSATENPHTLELQPVRPELVGCLINPNDIDLLQLLTHTSGLHAWASFFLKPQPVLEQISQMGFAGMPGQQIIYSDLGYILLGEWLARYFKKPLLEIMLQQVMKPLELEKTVFNPLQTDQFKTSQILPTELDMRWRKRRLWGEVHDENAFAMDGISGHAGLFGSALNLAQFGQACLVQDKRLNISPAFFEQALKPQAEDSSEKRGLGVMLNLPGKSSCGDGFGARSFGHTGYTGTSLWIDPDSEVVVACLTNAVYYGRNMKMYSFRRKLHTLIHAA